MHPITSLKTPELKGAQCLASNPSTNNPILIANGNKYLNETDVSENVLGGLPITRSYNSSGVYSTLDSGKNWKLNLDRSMTFETADMLTVYRPDGRQRTFVRNGQVFQAATGGSGRVAPLTVNGTNTGWQLIEEQSGNIETYDLYGVLLSITAPDGKQWTITRGTDGRITKVTNQFGVHVDLQYDSNYRLSGLLLPDGSQITYGYDGPSNLLVSNLTSVTYPDGKTKTYHYEHASFKSALTGITDENNVRFMTYSYDTQGRAYEEVTPATSNIGSNVNHTKLTYATDNTNGNPTTTYTDVTDALGTKRTYRFTNILGVVRSTGTDQPAGSGCAAAANNITYDTTTGNISSRLDFNQNKTCYGYDSQGRNLETARIEGLGTADVCTTQLAANSLTGVARKISTQWHSYWNFPTQTAEPKRLTTWIYNGDSYAGNVVSCAPATALIGTQPIGVLCRKIIQATTDTTGVQGLNASIDNTVATRTWSYTYNDNGQMLTIDGPRTDVTDKTTYTYYTTEDTTTTPPKYRKGDLKSVTDALSHTTTITTYDGNGRPLTITDPNTITTTLTYTPKGWLQTKTVGAKTTTYAYTPTGQLKTVTLPDTSHIDYTYDDAHRLTDISDTLLNRIHYTLDAIGNRTKEEIFDANNTLSTTKSHTFDALSRLEQDITTYNQGTSKTLYTYDAGGNLKSITEGYQGTPHVTSFDYDALNRLQSTTAPTDPLNPAALRVTQYGYDNLDQLKSVTDPRNLTTHYTVNGKRSMNSNLFRK